jgi:hypothetical protein
MTVPCVLGLDLDEAKEKLNAAGFADMEILVSGRRREGGPRVIRQKALDDKVELVVSHFKELTRTPCTENPPDSLRASPLR